MKSLKDLLMMLAQSELSKIHKYRDAHKGESCYIFGDGVSIKWFELDAFSSKLSISAGGLIPFHKSFSCLNAKYMMLTEPFWFYPGFWTKYVTDSTSMPYIQQAYRQIICDNPDKQFFLNLSNFPVVRSKNVSYVFRDISDDHLAENFITRRINAFHGSLRFSITMAIYMGFDHVYLVGCDYTHIPSRSLHWYEKGQGVFRPIADYNKDFFEIAKEFVDITTITLDGTSDFINAVTYKEHTGREPMFRENTELVDDRYLKTLATWPGYAIY